MFLDHTQRRSTVGRTPLDEWSARRRYLYLTTHDTHNGQIAMPPVGVEPTISVGERPATYKGHKATIHSLSKSGPYQATFCVLEQTWCHCCVWTTMKTPRWWTPTPWIHADIWPQKHTHTHTHTHSHTHIHTPHTVSLSHTHHTHTPHTHIHTHTTHTHTHTHTHT
jgi:hypothetical protein